MNPHNTSRPITLTSFVIWGARGQVPKTATAAIYGGIHTACVEVRLSDGRSLVFDAGSGIVPLGHNLAKRGVRLLNVFLTHLHQGHIQGLPQLPLLDDPNATVRIYGPGTPTTLEDALTSIFSPPFQAVPWNQRAAHKLYGSVEHGAVWEEGGVEIEAFRARHFDETYGYRIHAGGRTLVYIPDNEIVGGNHPTEHAWYDSLVNFAQGANVLIHDAMWFEDEYPNRRGLGHSTIGQAWALAEDAKVENLYLFHHESSRSDRDLLAQLQDIRTDIATTGSKLNVEIAREGWEVRI